MLHAVIMAGGSGTRFWPESRGARPKQLLQLVGERTMIQSTVDRLEPFVPPERVLIVTSAALLDQIRKQLPQLSARHRWWASRAVATPRLASAWPRCRSCGTDPEGIMAVMPQITSSRPMPRFSRLSNRQPHWLKRPRSGS